MSKAFVGFPRGILDIAFQEESYLFYRSRGKSEGRRGQGEWVGPWFLPFMVAEAGLQDLPLWVLRSELSNLPEWLWAWRKWEY